MVADWPEDEPTEAADAPTAPLNTDGGSIGAQRAARLLELVAAGTTVPKACAALGVKREAFWHLHARDGAFRDAVFQARLMGVEALADEILELADNRLQDPKDRALAIEARKWLLTKLMPRRYGDKLDLSVNHGRTIESMTDAEIDAEIARLRAAGVTAGEAEAEPSPDQLARLH